MALPNFTALANNPDYVVERYSGGTIKSITAKPVSYTAYQEYNTNNITESKFIPEEYTFSPEGFLVSGYKRYTKVDLQSDKQLRQSPYEKIIYSNAGGGLQEEVYETVSSKSGKRENVKFMERNVLTAQGFEQVAYQQNLTPTQIENRQTQLIKKIGLETNTANKPVSQFNQTISKKLTPEQGALILGVAQQQVKASPKFEALRSQRLAEYKQQIKKPTEATTILMGGKLELSGTVTPFKESKEQRAFIKAVNDFEKVGYSIKDIEGESLSNVTIELERDNKKTFLDIGFGYETETINKPKDYFYTSNFQYVKDFKTTFGITKDKVIGIVPKETIFRTDIARKLKPIRVIETEPNNYGIKKLFKDITTVGGKGYEQAEKGAKYIETKTRFINEYSAKVIPSFDETGIQITDKLNKFYPDFDIKEFENQSTLYDKKIPKIKAIATGSKIIREFSKFSIGTAAGGYESIRTKPRKIIATAGAFYLLEPVIAGVGSIKYLGKPLLKGVGIAYGGSVLLRLGAETDSYSQGKKLGEIINTELVPMGVGSYAGAQTLKAVSKKISRKSLFIEFEKINEKTNPLTKKETKLLNKIAEKPKELSVQEKEVGLNDKIIKIDINKLSRKQAGFISELQKAQKLESYIEIDFNPVDESPRGFSISKKRDLTEINKIKTSTIEQLSKDWYTTVDRNADIEEVKAIERDKNLDKIEAEIRQKMKETGLTARQILEQTKRDNQATEFNEAVKKAEQTLQGARPTTNRVPRGTDPFKNFGKSVDNGILDKGNSIREIFTGSKQKLKLIEETEYLRGFKELSDNIEIEFPSLKRLRLSDKLNLLSEFKLLAFPTFSKLNTMERASLVAKQNLTSTRLTDFALATKQNLDLRLKLDTALTSKQSLTTKQDLRLDTALTSKQSVLQSLTTKQDLRLDTTLKSKQLLKLDIIDIIEPVKIDIPKLSFNLGDKRKKIKSYDVYGKEKGKYLKLNKEPLPINRARNLGADAIDNTSSATFKLTKAKKKTKLTDDFSFMKSSKFRVNSKTPNSYIELNKNRIDTAGELAQITLKGWIANRNKNRMLSF